MTQRDQTDTTLRLFIAVDLSAEARAVLRDTQTRLRQQRLPVRWVNPDGAHVTLKFLGAVDSSQVDDLTAQLHKIAARHRPLMLQTGALGAFPSMTQPRVVWLALDGDRAALQHLRDDVEREIAPLGFPTEDRPFSPHLTLGRTQRDVTPSQRKEIGRVLARQPVSRAVSFDVKEIILMRSDLSPSGARYTPLAKASMTKEEA